MIRIRTNIGHSRVLTVFSNNEWVTMASGMQSKGAASLLEAGQNHLMAARALYLANVENERRMNAPHIPMPGEIWDAK